MTLISRPEQFSCSHYCSKAGEKFLLGLKRDSALTPARTQLLLRELVLPGKTISGKGNLPI
jgi:hypothetical protein